MFENMKQYIKFDQASENFYVTKQLREDIDQLLNALNAVAIITTAVAWFEQKRFDFAIEKTISPLVYSINIRTNTKQYSLACTKKHELVFWNVEPNERTVLGRSYAKYYPVVDIVSVTKKAEQAVKNHKDVCRDINTTLSELIEIIENYNDER